MGPMPIQFRRVELLQPSQVSSAISRWTTPKPRKPLHLVAWHHDDGRPLPTVDWRRRSQRILFVDR